MHIIDRLDYRTLNLDALTRASAIEARRYFLDTILNPEPWCIDSIEYAGGVLEITGWAIPPQGQHEDVRFWVNGQEFAHCVYPNATPRPDVAQLFWYKKGVEQTSFRCRAQIPPSELFKEGYATLEYVSNRTRQPISSDHTYYFSDEHDGIPLPDGPRRKRVSGSEQSAPFRLDGYTTFRKLDLALGKVYGKSLGDFGRILDWGCGCGRVTRYFSRLPQSQLIGADIDVDNLRWCRQNFKFGTFHEFPLHPPTSLPAASADLIFGISVFTHLRERDHLKWLAELQRLVSPGGVVLVTVLGPTTICRTPCDDAFINAWQGKGFAVIANQRDLKGHIDDESYYVSTFMTPDYIHDVWSQFFTVDQILPGYIGNQQDLVVLRKPA